ncbi:hypothetical protein NX059_011915 [Plenodomus lindquistii]|nr:hypothetical protein NX059_011915 [Plenodomus lindquistii]
MRLLHIQPGSDLSLVEYVETIPPYAILSHTWGLDHEEITYKDLTEGREKIKAGYSKLTFCKQQALRDGLEYFWVDTCCIDKSSSAELTEAINSMFQWYHDAAKCYVYLSDVSTATLDGTDRFSRQSFKESRWFTRGWTLQELIAPTSVDFFSVEGKRIGDRTSLLQDIHDITGISPRALQGTPLPEFTIDTRFSWAEKRNTKRGEDKAYSLLGIFGISMPMIYGEGKEKAFRRLHEEIAKLSIQRHGQQADPSRGVGKTTQAPWVMPLPRPRAFVGREMPLLQLSAHISSEDGQRLAVYGLGGCGKTALALECAYRTREQQPTRDIIWVPAFNRESFEQAYQEIATLLHIPNPGGKADIKELVKTRLSNERSGRWLMIVDNADDDSVLFGPLQEGDGAKRLVDFLPRSSKGSIVFTTRTRAAAVKLAQSNVIALDKLNREEATDLLKTRLLSEHQQELQDEATVDEFLTMLAFFALAIVQAAAFMNTNGITLSGYISFFKSSEQDATDLLSEEFEDQGRYRDNKNPVATTLYISFEAIQEQNPLAAEYLSFMACVDSYDIPITMLPAVGSKLEQTKAIGMLTAYAFIIERQEFEYPQEGTHGSSQAFDVHPLVHLAMRSWLKYHNNWKLWTERSLERLTNIVPYGDIETREDWTAYLPHAIKLLNLPDLHKVEDKMSLLARVGRCEFSLGRYNAAEETYRKLVEERNKVSGHEHEDSLRARYWVAVTIGHQGKYSAAENMLRELLAVQEKVLGRTHPGTLNNLRLLAATIGQRNGKEAEEMFKTTLESMKTVLGQDDPSTLKCMDGLAAILGAQGMYAKAEKTYRDVLAITETSGKDHLEILRTRCNLATALSLQGKFKEAEDIEREALVKRTSALGKEHPDTLTSMCHLACTLCDQGMYAEAGKMHRKTLALRERVLGKEHPDTINSVYKLGFALNEQTQYEEATQLYRRACAGYLETLGPDHPHTRNCLYRYSIIRQKYNDKSAEGDQLLLNFAQQNITAEHQQKPQPHNDNDNDNDIYNDNNDNDDNDDPPSKRQRLV